ncbi:MAG: archease [Candidatus Diapherotrites archaeon]
MPFRVLEKDSAADIALEASAPSLAMLFGECALGVENQMADIATLARSRSVSFSLSAPEPEKLLFQFLNELLFFKDAQQLLFGKISVQIDEKGGKWTLTAKCWGEKINPKKHELLNDVKACTFHGLSVQKQGKNWKARVLLDV